MNRKPPEALVTALLTEGINILDRRPLSKDFKLIAQNVDGPLSPTMPTSEYLLFHSKVQSFKQTP